MDNKQPASGASGDDHYQPWLRNGDAAPATSAGRQRPAPLPTRPKATIEQDGDPAPPMRSAHLTADELLARPIAFTDPAPGALGLIDRLSQGVSDGSAAVRDAWQKGGISDAVARLDLGRRARQGGAALAGASRWTLAWAGSATRQTGATLGPIASKTGSALAEGSRRLANSARDAVASASAAMAARAKPAPLLPPVAATPDAAPDTAPPAAPLPLFGEPEAPARKPRKAAAAANGMAAVPESFASTPPSRPASPAQSGGVGRPWLRHPATLALGGACLLSAGFAAGLYWTGPGVDRATTERVIHDYLLNNPEILPQAMERLQANQAAVAVNRLRARIETPFSGAWAGAADGDVVLTIFTDYACTFCRASLADVERLLAEDRRLKVVFRELPILSADSEPAARLALAAARRGRYMAMHRALFVSRTPDAAARTAAADSLGIATGSAVTGAAQITQELEGNIALARELGFDGTPSWVVGDRMLTGAVGYEQLKAAVADARAG